MKAAFILMISLSALTLSAQDAQPEIRKGNELYRQQQYKEAEEAYNQATQADPENNTAAFNKATAVYRQSRTSEAIKGYEDLAFKSLDKSIKNKAHYNKGVILSGQKKLEESIEAYKHALRQDPNDNEARENLQKALMELKKKKPDPEKKDDKNQQQQQQQKKQQQQPKMNQKEAQQRLKLLEQKEKDVQERLQKSKSSGGGGQRKDW